MTQELNLKCEVCDKPAVGVASSFLPISIAYCAECLQAGREPYGLCVMRVMGCAPHGELLKREHIAEWCLPVLDISIEFAGKTWEEFAKDVKEADESLDKEND